MKKSFIFIAATAALIAPVSAPAQDFKDGMDALIANMRVEIDVSRPGDENLTCDQIRAELMQHNQSMANAFGGVNKIVDNQMKANEVERKARVAAKTARDIANSVAPAGTAPGNAIEAAADRALDSAQKAREAKTLAQVGVMSTNLQFISQRIPYLHDIAGGRCGAGAGEQE